MLKKFFTKTKKVELLSPMTGELIPLETVPDPVFSQKMMGEGVAIIPYTGEVRSPIDAEVLQVAPTKHAIGLKTVDGTEILIHIGLDTVHLKGEGFTIHVAKGGFVKKGDLLADVDVTLLKERGYHILTPVIITNNASTKYEYKIHENKNVTANDSLIISYECT
ncbi:PTS sugar transporter subunit IIA [Halalkalibacter hemicellulosilyticus]|uniref:PTS system n=1 Tax=Halalkalibacter hemicellulosilyticusJCM 9152 TaxID=1236971 RepID=W4QCH1_9BACI|nr:PTS glucose transporter subunit IIA [Halalkalibacter hemicellulosilyticus]GAE29652.1 PTS system [Halalkalibacter hemicellulosilyticusJCM 9152]